MQIFVKIVTTKTLPLDVQASDSIKDILEKINGKEGSLLGQQSFSFHGKELKNETTLSDNEVKEGSTLQLDLHTENSRFQTIYHLLRQTLKKTQAEIQNDWRQTLQFEEKIGLMDSMNYCIRSIAGLVNKGHEYSATLRLSLMMQEYNLEHIQKGCGEDILATSKNQDKPQEWKIEHKHANISEKGEASWNVNFLGKRESAIVQNAKDEEMYKLIMEDLGRGFHVFTASLDGVVVNEYYLSNQILALYMTGRRYKKDEKTTRTSINFKVKRCQHCKQFHRILHLTINDKGLIKVDPEDFVQKMVPYFKNLGNIKSQEKCEIFSLLSAGEFIDFLERLKYLELVPLLKSKLAELNPKVWKTVLYLQQAEVLSDPKYKDILKFVNDWVDHYTDFDQPPDVNNPKVKDLFRNLDKIPKISFSGSGVGFTAYNFNKEKFWAFLSHSSKIWVRISEKKENQNDKEKSLQYSWIPNCFDDFWKILKEYPMQDFEDFIDGKLLAPETDLESELNESFS